MSTYSFSDTSTNISHPSVGQYSLNGTGIGSITYNMATDNTVQEVSADGVVMTSYVLGKNGTIAIQIQQTSALHKWLLKWDNYIKSPSATLDEYTAATITTKVTTLGITYTATGVAPQKKADTPYQSQGQMVTWNLLAESIDQVPY